MRLHHAIAVAVLASGLPLGCTETPSPVPDVSPDVSETSLPVAEAPQVATIEEIAAELVEMAKADQRYRDFETIMAMPKDEQQAFIIEGGEADLRHTARLQEIVADHGWPTRELVGEEASQAAFILVQHADANPAFQSEMLPLLEAEAARGEVALAEVAYLTDRVRVKEGRPQVYATQYSVKTNDEGAAIADADGKLTYLLPIVEDIDELDARRAAAGLGPWITYERQMAASQGRTPAERPRVADTDAP